jgi:hypothetical protein
MSIQNLFEEFIDHTDLKEKEQIDVLLDFIDNMGLENEFTEHLENERDKISEEEE